MTEWLKAREQISHTLPIASLNPKLAIWPCLQFHFSTRISRHSHSSVKEHYDTPHQEKSSCNWIVREASCRTFEEGWNSPSYPPPEQKATPISTCPKTLVCLPRWRVEALFVWARHSAFAPQGRGSFGIENLHTLRIRKPHRRHDFYFGGFNSPNCREKECASKLWSAWKVDDGQVVWEHQIIVPEASLHKSCQSSHDGGKELGQSETSRLAYVSYKGQISIHTMDSWSIQFIPQQHSTFSEFGNVNIRTMHENQ